MRTFHTWIRERSPRTAKGIVSVYTPFGINNQWGACSTLDDEQTLHVLGHMRKWQQAGVRFDYFTLDTGWVDRSHDLTRFRPVAYPEGPSAVLSKVRQFGMRFGLWFATSWASESCWDYRPAWGKREPPVFTWRNGYPALSSYPGSFCLAAEPYFQLLKSAVLHHIRTSGIRFLKLDGGNYACEDTSHGHLPGRYAVEHMHDLLIELAAAAHAEAPDLYILWYWGLRSPFWALHGDMIFESGLFMEGSGTSSTPGLHYRDSVTLAQDQNARNAKTIPPMNKDSLGVWIADTRWGNFLGRERWREALVMDLGRGNLLWPNLWGDLYLLDDEDLRFMAEMQELAKRHERLLMGPRIDLGDPLDGRPYGYAYGDRGSGLVFLNNPSFVSQAIPLTFGQPLGLSVRQGARVRVDSVFPDRERVEILSDAVELWLRPFETLLLEVRASGAGLCPDPGPRRDLSRAAADRLGIRIALDAAEARPDLAVTLADAARLETLGHRPRAECFRAALPDLEGKETPILAVSVRLIRGGQEWKYSPVVAEIVQAVARIDGERAVLVPVPDARQFGNTQKGRLLLDRIQDPDAQALVVQGAGPGSPLSCAPGRLHRDRSLGGPPMVEGERETGGGRLLRGVAVVELPSPRPGGGRPSLESVPHPIALSRWV